MAKPLKLRMDLGERSYAIQIGAGAIESLPDYVRTRKSKKIVLLSDQRLKQARKKILSLFPKAEFEFQEIPLKAGESLKEIDSVYPIYGKLLKAKADRDTLLLALGGGSIGDAAGFVASTYLRGIDWVGIPTTLLAQVDSSVGGKTGINHRDGKNLIGSFHQPRLVICDINFLKTLGPRELVSGLGEMIKYSLTFDPKFFNFIVKHKTALEKLSPKEFTLAVETSLRLKCQAVAADEFDRTGAREVLNFGHTFAHALESVTHYTRYQHGEAVIWGMRFALALSQVRGHLKLAEREKMDAVLSGFKVPTLPKGVPPETYFQAMKKDKKSSANRVRFVLLSELGKTISDSSVSEDDLQTAYRLMTSKKRGGSRD